MEPIRFADILFTLLTLVIIYIILVLVKKSQHRKKQSLNKTSDTTPESAADTEEDS